MLSTSPAVLDRHQPNRNMPAARGGYRVGSNGN
jgi:hypothetical protein